MTDYMPEIGDIIRDKSSGHLFLVTRVKEADVSVGQLPGNRRVFVYSESRAFMNNWVRVWYVREYCDLISRLNDD